MSRQERATDPDAALALLSHERRRTVLESIVERGGVTTRQALVRDVAEEETGKPVDEVERARIHEIHISLYHEHLPKLCDWDLIEHNRDTGEVALSDGGDTIQTVVETAEETVSASREVVEDFHR